jgi:hypothetical protein
VPNDAKLGLVAGLGLLLAVAIFFARKDPTRAEAPAETQQITARASGLSPSRPAQQVSGTPARHLAQKTSEETPP